MEWDNNANIGYSAGGDPYDNHDPSSSDVACVNSPDSDWSNAVYQISSSTPEDPPAGKPTFCYSPQAVKVVRLCTEDLEFSNITHSSAVVSWTVPSLSTAQDYVVEYGEDEDDLDLSTNTTLLFEEYSITLEGLSQGVLYHVRVATTDADGATFYSEIESFHTIM